MESNKSPLQQILSMCDSLDKAMEYRVYKQIVTLKNGEQMPCFECLGHPYVTEEERGHITTLTEIKHVKSLTAALRLAVEGLAKVNKEMQIAADGLAEKGVGNAALNEGIEIARETLAAIAQALGEK